MAQQRPAPRIQLDWKRLLGFDQARGDGDAAAAANLTDPRLIRLGAKVSGKPSG